MNSLIQKVAHRLNMMKSDESSIKQYLTLKNVLLLLILLDICRSIAVFSQVLSPYNIGQMELNMSIFVGLGVVAFYGVCVGQRSLLFVYLSFYVGLIASSLSGSSRGFHHHSTCCVNVDLVLQIALSAVLIRYILTHLPPKKEEKKYKNESTKHEEFISPKEFTHPEEGARLKEDIRPEEGAKLKEGMRPEGGAKLKEGIRPEEAAKIVEGTKLEKGNKPEEDIRPE